MSEGRFSVRTPECEKVADGRRRHHFVKADGQFRCNNCGEPANARDPWGQHAAKKAS